MTPVTAVKNTDFDKTDLQHVTHTHTSRCIYVYIDRTTTVVNSKRWTYFKYTYVCT